MRRLIAMTILSGLYGATWMAGLIGRCLRRSGWTPTGRIAVMGTFHNPGWYRSHVLPLTRCGAGEVLLVVDRQPAPLGGVRFVVPPRWAVRLFGRGGAKALWLLRTALFERPDLVMGYSLLPASCSAMVAGALIGRPAGYQATGGPIEVDGGGYARCGPLTAALKRPSPALERLAVAAVRQFDLVVVRGGGAQRYFLHRGLNGTVAVITGSITRPPAVRRTRRDIDMIYVGRLEEVKRPERFLDIAAAVRRERADLRAVFVGDGSLNLSLREQARRLDLDDNVTFLGRRNDVFSLLGRSKVFVLTSRSEGLSIAMVEAMSAGAVPVVSDVGDLGDLVDNGRTGWRTPPDNLDVQGRYILRLLGDDRLRSTLSENAAESAWRRCGVNTVAANWKRRYRDTLRRAGAKNIESIHKKQ